MRSKKKRRQRAETYEFGFLLQFTTTKKVVVGGDAGDEGGRKKGSGRELHGFDFECCF